MKCFYKIRNFFLLVTSVYKEKMFTMYIEDGHEAPIKAESEYTSVLTYNLLHDLTPT